MKKLFPIVLSLFCSISIYAQLGVLEGQVTDESGEIMIGATIKAKFVSPIDRDAEQDIEGSEKGAITDIDGNYRLELKPGIYRIEFSYVGYNKSVVEAQAIEDGFLNILDIVLIENKELLETIVVSASKYGRKLTEETVSIEVIKPKVIQSIASPDLSETVDLIPGAYIIDGQINIRGGTGFSYGAGARVQLVLDDLPLMSADRGDIKWNFIPLEHIDQVELIKGASSVLYGSAALNGVVHVRTRWPGAEPSGRFVTYAGTFALPEDNLNSTIGSIAYDPDTGVADTTFVNTAPWDESTRPIFGGTYFSWMKRMGKEQKFDLVLGGGLASTPTHNEDELQEHIRTNFKLRYRPTERLSFGLAANGMFYNEGLYLLWSGDGSMHALEGATDRNYYSYAYVDPFLTWFDPIGNKHSFKGRLYNLLSFYEAAPPNDARANLFGAQYQFERSFLDEKLNLTAGFNAWKYDVIDNALVKNEGNIYATYLTTDAKLWDRLNLSAGIRWEAFQTEDFTGGSLPVFKGGANYELSKKHFLRASFGQGFRIPSLAERYVDFNVGSINFLPNENLKPEIGWNSEIGYKGVYNLGNWRLSPDFAFYVTDYSNMTESVFDLHVPDGTLLTVDNVEQLLRDSLGFQFQNISEARIAGYELSVSGSGKLGSLPFTLLGGYTYAFPGDLTADTTLQDWGNYFSRFFQSINSNDTLIANSVLKYRFRHLAKADANLQVRKISVGLNWQYYSFMERIDDIFVNESDIFNAVLGLLDAEALQDIEPSLRTINGIGSFRDRHLDGDHVFGARLAWLPNERTTISLITKNIFNRAYAIRPAKMDAPMSWTLQYAVDF